jgi:ubiquitin C-terminal hydrolase
MERLTLQDIKNQKIFETKGLSGLINLGNTCFMNSIIQCLSNTENLTEFFLKRENIKESQMYNKKVSKQIAIVISYSNILRAIWEKNRLVKPTTFKRVLCLFNERYAGYDQQDSHEFLICILNLLHDGLKYPVSIEINGKIENEHDSLMKLACESFKKEFENEYSIIINLFYGQFYNFINCTKCNYSEKRFESFNTISLNFPETNASNSLTLNELFKYNFSKDEQINNWECSKVKCKNKICNKNTKLFKLPKFLIIHLNRFKKNATGELISKNDTLIDFDINNIDLTSFFPSTEKNNWMYSLYAINYHSGTINSGHYTSVCKNKDGHWYIYNDAHLDKYTNFNKNQLVTKDSYIFFLTRIEK